MRRSGKEQRVTSPDAQILQPAYSEAMALPSSGIGNAELSNELASGSEQLKLIPKKTFRS
jgi:hypothetical protein